MRHVLLFLLLLATACTRSAAGPAEPGLATVVEVVDGDTVVVDLAGRRETLRLIGVDTSTPASLHPVGLSVSPHALYAGRSAGGEP